MVKMGKRVILLSLVCWCLMGTRAQAAEKAQDRVLFISSYSYAWEPVQQQIEGIQDELQGRCTIDYEYMDTKRVNDETSLQLFYEGLAYRMSRVEAYDAVLLGDDAALVFAMEHRETLFDGIPLVFLGVNDEELAQEAVQQEQVAGVLEKLSVEKNVELGRRINPEAKKVVAILDDTITGEAERKRFYKCAESYPELTFSEINASALTSSQLYMELSRVSSDSILIFIVMTEDASGKQYANRQAISLITGAADVPVIRMVEDGIGDGLLGGNVVSMYHSGEMAARMAIAFIDGNGCNEVADSPDIFCVDADVMEKYDISETVLPEGTTIINRKQNFMERNREAMIPVAVLLSGVAVVLLVVMTDNVKRRKLLSELQEAKKIMENAAEHDFLTGIPNRSRFMSDLNELFVNKTPCTVIMIDIDDFKKINDSMGHTAGDDALQQIAARLKDMSSQILTPYRFAGDEFILILKSNQERIVEKTAYQCRQLFSKPVMLCGVKTMICGSIGIASYPKDTEDMEQLVICADDAMYQVKKSGKNAFAFFDKSKSC